MKWHLNQETSALLHTMTGSDNAEDATEVTLFVGESHDDDGKLIHGLHAYETEYPEEGVIPLVEFPPPSHTALLQRVLPYLERAAESTLSDSYQKSLTEVIAEVRAALGVEEIPRG